MSEPIIDEAAYFEETGKLFPPGVMTREGAEGYVMAERSLEMVKVLQVDIEREVNTMEGAAFNGHNVAVRFGELMAEVSALAKVVELMLERELEKS